MVVLPSHLQGEVYVTKLEVLELAGVKKRRRPKGAAICTAAAIFMLVLFAQFSGALTEPGAAYGAIWQDFFVNPVQTDNNSAVRFTVGYRKGKGLYLQTLEETPIKVVVDGTSVVSRTTLPRLEDILQEAGVELGPKDRVEARFDTSSDQMPELVVVRVNTRIVTEEEKIPFQVKSVQDPSLAPGSTRIKQAGQDGLLMKKYEVTTENGEVVQKRKLGSEVIKEPVTQITAVGVRSKTKLASRGVSLHNKRVLKMIATAYTHTGNPTASGVMPYVGGVAVDPKVIPLGTELYVEGYGYAKAVDTGGLIKGNRIDVFLETAKECYQWGRREVKVYILD
jgi:3D (Asp-Asp-Asp) domain-containing protein